MVGSGMIVLFLALATTFTFILLNTFIQSKRFRAKAQTFPFVIPAINGGVSQKRNSKHSAQLEKCSLKLKHYQNFDNDLI